MIANLEGGGGYGPRPPGESSSAADASLGAIVPQLGPKYKGIVGLPEAILAEPFPKVATDLVFVDLADMVQKIQSGQIEAPWPFLWKARRVITVHELHPIADKAEAFDLGNWLRTEVRPPDPHLWETALEVGFGKFRCKRCRRIAAMNICPGGEPEIDRERGTAPAFEDRSIGLIDGTFIDNSNGVAWEIARQAFTAPCYSGRELV